MTTEELAEKTMCQMDTAQAVAESEMAKLVKEVRRLKGRNTRPDTTLILCAVKRFSKVADVSPGLAKSLIRAVFFNHIERANTWLFNNALAKLRNGDK